MDNKTFRNYYLFSLLGVFILSCYPIYMGISVVVDVIRFGSVSEQNYPKYIIPYTPIAIAIIVGVAFIPFSLKLLKKYALLFGTMVSAVVFFVSELLLENKIVVKRTFYTLTEINEDAFSRLEDWQLSLCAVTPEVFKSGELTEVEILMGKYNPAFKLHFYIISFVVIFVVLNCFYGFAKMIKTGNKIQQKALIVQTITASAFLGMCIWACFTAFYRTGDINISALSAILMGTFFVLMGVTSGTYIASFLINKKSKISIILPAVVASVITFVMYIGEMILLNGHLYRFGKGFMFEGISKVVLAPIDIIVILLSGGIVAIIAKFIHSKNN